MDCEGGIGRLCGRVIEPLGSSGLKASKQENGTRDRGAGGLGKKVKCGRLGSPVLSENFGARMARGEERDMAQQNIQTKAGMSFKNNKMDFKHVLIPFCRKGWKMEIQKSKIETGNGKIRNRKFKIRMKEKPKVRHKPCEAPAYVSKSTSPNLSQALCYSRDSQEIAAGMREPRILRE